ncbi:MAG: hypothetical protein K6G73_10985 [Marinilabiliaceae bacterium]|nr:hypothetical protein [Marinilabiliaceae bacterium]
MIVYDIFVVITGILQITAAIVAIMLMKYTKFNISWVLFSMGLVIISIRRVIDFVALFRPDFGFESPEFYSWGGIFVSFCFAIGIFTLRRIFRLLHAAEIKQRDYEKKLLQSVIHAEENERRRFASELHDGLGPLLSSVKMGVSAISNDIQDEEIRKNLVDAVNEAITTTREISNNISPHILSSFGIESAVNRFVSSLTLKNSEPKFDLNISIKNKRYPETIEIVVYRVICELINNTIRHAHAHNVHLSLMDENNTLLINYSDDGIGFDFDKALKYSRHGMGYYNMKSRVTSLKGSIEFSDNNGRGMNAYIKIPTYDF